MQISARLCAMLRSTMMKAGLLLSVLSYEATAQAPDCNLARKAYDGGVVLRRYQWHAGRALAAAGTGEAIHKVGRIQRVVAYAASAVVVGVVPHIFGVSTHRYPFNGKDWIADGTISALPLVAVVSFGADGWKPKVLGAALLPAGYFAVACYASP